ncbi:protein FAR-RED ELONGATED HYPOCOTYL 3-like [Vicia villosa]|uniref:protein FAR-RED ELONGATED HYPOCOTYL 3-like n=1 Tax=Vicia villosa TaxID=3911 RepID=UPI00273B261C|nr:protein FAR-RED ELONGATED HYPOCOTYL 3-like [Vicia villosa]
MALRPDLGSCSIKLNAADYDKNTGGDSKNFKPVATDGNVNSHNDDFGELDAIASDRKVNINALTADEIRAMEFGMVDEAYEFYFKYGKCKGFAIRKSDVRTRGTEGGCKHHSQTVVFGATLVSNETTDTYKWLLECFLECMNDKYPEVVVTDVDKAIREAIKQVVPDATHCLCTWHLNKNAGENVKNSGFLQGFQKAMYSNFTKDEFEDFLLELIKDNGLERNPWVVKTYENKSLWATAYLRERFFGGIRTTSQYEAVNAIIKSYVRKKGHIFEFMHNFEQALRSYRKNELVSNFKSNFSEPVMSTHLHEIERHAVQIYTAKIFKKVKDEIMKVGSLIVNANL